MEEGEDVEEVVLHGLGEVYAVAGVVSLEDTHEFLVLPLETFLQVLEAAPAAGDCQTHMLVEEGLVI